MIRVLFLDRVDRFDRLVELALFGEDHHAGHLEIEDDVRLEPAIGDGFIDQGDRAIEIAALRELLKFFLKLRNPLLGARFSGKTGFIARVGLLDLLDHVAVEAADHVVLKSQSFERGDVEFRLLDSLGLAGLGERLVALAFLLAKFVEVADVVLRSALLVAGGRVRQALRVAKIDRRVTLHGILLAERGVCLARFFAELGLVFGNRSRPR